MTWQQSIGMYLVFSRKGVDEFSNNNLPLFRGDRMSTTSTRISHKTIYTTPEYRMNILLLFLFYQNKFSFPFFYLSLKYFEGYGQVANCPYPSKYLRNIWPNKKGAILSDAPSLF